jgi:hypothetical protein
MGKGDPKALGTFAALEAQALDAANFAAHARKHMGDDALAVQIAERLEAQAVALLYFAKRYVAPLMKEK